MESFRCRRIFILLFLYQEIKKILNMKIKKFALLLCLALCACCLPANASSLGDIRVNARFLTDRMAFELNLNQSQYNDLFEINFDFLSGVDPYLTENNRSSIQEQ
jgi:hypothetical protein